MSISPPINSRRARAGRMEMRWAGIAGTVSLLTSVGFGEGLRRSLSVNPPLRRAICASRLNRLGWDGGEGTLLPGKRRDGVGGQIFATDLFLTRRFGLDWKTNKAVSFHRFVCLFFWYVHCFFFLLNAFRPFYVKNFTLKASVSTSFFLFFLSCSGQPVGKVPQSQSTTIWRFPLENVKS